MEITTDDDPRLQRQPTRVHPVTGRDQVELTAISIPRSVFWGLVVPLVVFICTGSAYLANLSMTVANQGANQSANQIANQVNQTAISARVSAVENKVDANKDAGSVTTATINERLTRMEAQLGFLVKASEGHK